MFSFLLLLFAIRFHRRVCPFLFFYIYLFKSPGAGFPRPLKQNKKNHIERIFVGFFLNLALPSCNFFLFLSRPLLCFLFLLFL